VAENDWPAVLSFDPKSSPSLTVRCVPSGTTTGGGACCADCAGVVEEPVSLPLAVDDGASELDVAELDVPELGVAEFAVVFPALFEHPARTNSSRIENAKSGRTRILFPPRSHFLDGEVQKKVAKQHIRSGKQLWSCGWIPATLSAR
jgi:hypothetical protein